MEEEHAAILLNHRCRCDGATDAAAVPDGPPADDDAEFPESAAEDDDGPFFDLEFAALPFDYDDGDGSCVDSGDGDVCAALEDEDDDVDEGEKGEKEIEIVVPAIKSGAGEMPPDAKDPIPAILLKSASKLRVLMLALKKPRSAAAEGDGGAGKQQCRFLVKLEDVPIAAFFTRDGSSRISGGGGGSAVAEEKGISKEAVMRYLQKIKPLESLILQVAGTLKPPAAPANKQLRTSASLPARLRVARKRLGKTMSAPLAPSTARLPSSTAAASPAPAPSRRRDDSLMQQEDGIQGAIAHCKRSFNEERIPSC